MLHWKHRQNRSYWHCNCRFWKVITHMSIPRFGSNVWFSDHWLSLLWSLQYIFPSRGIHPRWQWCGRPWTQQQHTPSNMDCIAAIGSLLHHDYCRFVIMLLDTHIQLQCFRALLAVHTHPVAMFKNAVSHTHSSCCNVVEHSWVYTHIPLQLNPAAYCGIVW